MSAQSWFACRRNLAVLYSQRRIAESEEISLVPHSRRLTVYDKVEDIPSATQRITYESAIVAVAPDCSDTFVVPFWAVQHTDDESKANCKIVFKQAKKHIGVIGIPTIGNRKAVTMGTELLLYAPKVENKQQKRPLALGAAASEKKPRV